jgi:D-ribose pyranose/furanose isomerase RbsD
MADGKVYVEQIAPVLVSNVVVKENICECCNIIKSELVELKSELKSCREIIRILHEEVQVESQHHVQRGIKRTGIESRKRKLTRGHKTVDGRIHRTEEEDHRK